MPRPNPTAPLTRPEAEAIIAGYVQMVRDRIARGFEPTLLSIMFNGIDGSDSAIGRQMTREVERIYAKHLTRVFRHPHREATADLPLWIGAPDWPVPKRERDHFHDLAPNGGRHEHLFALTPPVSRLRTTLADHFDTHQAVYSGSPCAVRRVHAKPITQAPEKVVEYVFKSLTRRRMNLDDVLVLPRTFSEL